MIKNDTCVVSDTSCFCPQSVEFAEKDGCIFDGIVAIGTTDGFVMCSHISKTIKLDDQLIDHNNSQTPTRHKHQRRTRNCEDSGHACEDSVTHTVDTSDSRQQHSTAFYPSLIAPSLPTHLRNRVVRQPNPKKRQGADYSTIRLWGWNRADSVKVVVGCPWNWSSVDDDRDGLLDRCHFVWLLTSAMAHGVRLYRYKSLGNTKQNACLWELMFAVEGSFHLFSPQLDIGVVALTCGRDRGVHFFSFKDVGSSHSHQTHENENVNKVNTRRPSFGRSSVPPTDNRPIRVAASEISATQNESIVGSKIHEILTNRDGESSPYDCGVDVCNVDTNSTFAVSIGIPHIVKQFTKEPKYLQALNCGRWAVVKKMTIHVVEVLQSGFSGPSLFHRNAYAAQLRLGEAVSLNGHNQVITRLSYDGNRRLATLDRDDELIVWDTQKLSKVFGVTLRRISDSPEVASGWSADCASSPEHNSDFGDWCALESGDGFASQPKVQWSVVSAS
eukprot:CAMPEP_0113847894 /NCGR_PEP_ID=MMETSP0372-20130328/2145_1 /TAXON_ID=340204 /ORGANISM="Lankesteria abbotti" /LENGTH=499 /DNA_ID=CAMNT_0000817257 /DNA_START=673 /DNA_END=2169 /DNA_ORIENTATION=+ /assembly_acc=CAM_ASM_000359